MDRVLAGAAIELEHAVTRAEGAVEPAPDSPSQHAAEGGVREAGVVGWSESVESGG